MACAPRTEVRCDSQPGIAPGRCAAGRGGGDDGADKRAPQVSGRSAWHGLSVGDALGRAGRRGESWAAAWAVGAGLSGCLRGRAGGCWALAGRAGADGPGRGERLVRPERNGPRTGLALICLLGRGEGRGKGRVRREGVLGWVSFPLLLLFLFLFKLTQPNLFEFKIEF